MRNTLGNLNNHLYEQLERLMDGEVSGAELDEEIKRANAIAGVASQIIKTGGLVLRAQQAADNFLDANVRVPRILKADEVNESSMDE